jgi:hypothetical protein
VKSTWIMGGLLLSIGLALHGISASEERARESQLAESLDVRQVLIPGSTPLTDADGRSVEQVAGVSITLPGQEPVTYVRRRGVWRALEYFAGVADGVQIESVFQQIYEATAVVEPASDEASLARYGLAPDQRVLVELQGRELFEREDRHVLFALEVGSARPGATGCFLRVHGESDVLASNRDLATPLATDGADPVPLLDERFATPGWPGFAAEPVALRLEHKDSGDFWIRKDAEAELPPLPPGADPETVLNQRMSGWVLEADGVDPEPLFPTWVLGYQLFIGTIEGGALVDPRSISPERQSRPKSRLTFQAEGVEPLELVLLGGLPGKPPVVINLHDQTAREVTEEIADLLFPDLLLFEGPVSDIPWDPYLR